MDIRTFWSRLESGIEVAVAASSSDVLLGVRDGFRRYFQQGLEHPVPVAVVPQGSAAAPFGLALGDRETIKLARGKAADLAERLGSTYHFYVGTEGGLEQIEISEENRYFVRSWAVLIGLAGEAWGGSGSIEIPGRFIAGGEEPRVAVPGTRRRGGLTASLTGGLETRRSSVALSVFNSLSSLFYDLHASHPLRYR